jgi:1-acyl-sn-glycerol-3-phosphate acyltransferase
MFRSLFAFSVLGVWTVVCSSLSVLTVLVTLSGDASIWIARRLWSPPLIWAARAKVSFSGGEGVDFSRPAIYVSNHQGMLDIPAIFVSLPVNLRFVAKESLRRVPFLGWYMWIAGYVFVDRSNRRKAVESLARAAQRIRNGVSVVVFPEGTRSADGHILPFKKGPFMLALKASVPIVPIAVEGSHRILNKNSLRVHPGHEIRVRIGAPLDVSQFADSQRDQLMRTVRDQIIDLHRAIGGLGGDKSDAVAAAGSEGVGASGHGEEGLA